jgi:tetratricopeptide (TPR) repeat protein
MSLPLLLLTIALLQQSDSPGATQKASGTPPAAPEQKPPEEDDSVKPKVYTFNPLNATKDIRTGDFYMKKGNYKAAVARYLEATKWNGQSAEAYRKLGEAEEKFDEPKEAREAYQKFLDLDPDSKEAAGVRKRLQKLPAS